MKSQAGSEREGLDTEVVSVLAQRAVSEGPRWMRAMETISVSNLSGGECEERMCLDYAQLSPHPSHFARERGAATGGCAQLKKSRHLLQRVRSEEKQIL